MTSGVIVINLDEVLGQFRGSMEDYEAAAAGALGYVALGLEREVKENWVAGGGSHKRGTKTPATPGGPPAAITGDLGRSIAATPAVKGFNGYEATVGAGMVYARALELGHPRWASGVRYPYMEPALKAFTPSAEGIFLQEFKTRWGQ
jgi:hypothetical protein